MTAFHSYLPVWAYFFCPKKHVASYCTIFGQRNALSANSTAPDTYNRLVVDVVAVMIEWQVS